MKEDIKKILLLCNSDEEFALKMYGLGENLLREEKLDSDELIWEVAREIWKERDLDKSTEERVYNRFQRYLGI
jgi:hypothetical protein